ncbi:MAG TPA: hypothetical protein VF516_45720 [Kofleriaceae bacterium]
MNLDPSLTAAAVAQAGPELNEALEQIAAMNAAISATIEPGIERSKYHAGGASTEALEHDETVDPDWLCRGTDECFADPSLEVARDHVGLRWPSVPQLGQLLAVCHAAHVAMIPWRPWSVVATCCVHGARGIARRGMR